MVNDFWEKDPFAIWEDWCKMQSPPLRIKTEDAENHGWHYDFKITKEKDGVLNIKFKLHRACKQDFEELAEYEKDNKKDYRVFKEKDEKKMRTMLAENILRFLEQHNALESIQLPRDSFGNEIAYNLDRGNAKNELDKFFRSRKMVKGADYDTGFDKIRGYFRFFYKFKDVSKNTFNCLRVFTSSSFQCSS